jgi:hypothetical protein
MPTFLLRAVENKRVIKNAVENNIPLKEVADKQGIEFARPL